MFYRELFLRHVYLIRVTALLTVVTSLFAAGSAHALKIETRRITDELSITATCSPPCAENFDGVTAPALPASWTANLAVGQPADLPWRTVNTTSDTAPNSVFADDPNHVTDNRLNSRTFPIVSLPAVLTFRRSNSLEENFDGMVLEISIPSVAGGAFQDIIAAGGSFGTGGYNATVSVSFGSPIGGRLAWTGDTGGFVTTTVNLPAAANGQNVTLRWRVASDVTVGSPGAFIDSISLTGWADAPANDNFRNAQQILGSSGLITGSNVGATKEASEPNHAGNAGGASVWYRWQAPSSGNFTFTTFDSTFNTLLAVYTGNSVSSLTPTVSNDDDPAFLCSGNTRVSRVWFDAIGGTIYYIAVDRPQFSGSGSIVLRWGRSASISGRITDVSGRLARADEVRLVGDTCRNSEIPGSISFTHVPTGGSYSVTVETPGYFFNRYGQGGNISPLTGDVSDYNYYVQFPAYTISGRVTITGGDRSGVGVMCVATGLGLISRAANFDSATGNYECAGLPTFGEYAVTPSKQGFNFLPPNRTVFALTQNISGWDFTGTLVPNTLQFAQTSFSVDEAAAGAVITVNRGGNIAQAVSVDYATSNGSANATTDYTIASGTLHFGAGETSKSFTILITDDGYSEGDETLNVTLGNAVNADLSGPATVVLTIKDNDATNSETNPIDAAEFFVRQHYYDFLNRFPDQTGLDYWTNQITSCGSDQLCLRARRIRVSDAFFFEPEYQTTGGYVFRLYRAAYGKDQPFPNPDNSNQTESKKLPGYLVFVQDRARVIGGANLATSQVDLANAFVQRPEFLARYPASLSPQDFINAVLATIQSADPGVDLSSQQGALMSLYNLGGRGLVMYRLADDNVQTNPVNNRAFIEAEYNRAFVFIEYAAYLRRDGDIGGLLFWLGQVNRFPLRDADIQHAMVCSFITSIEYQRRFSPVVTHTNAECPQ